MKKSRNANYGNVVGARNLVEGMVLALEPMINLGTRRIKQLKAVDNLNGRQLNK